MTANVALTDSFDQWRVKTNEVIVMTNTDGSSNFIKLLDTTNSTSNTTGSIITAGGIGVGKSAVIGENLRVHGDVTVDGDTTISGNLVFGDATTDQVTFTADINSNMIPNTDMTFDLGNTTFAWANTFTGHLTAEQGVSSTKPAITVTSASPTQIAIDVNADQSSVNVLDIDANSLTTGNVIDITAGALTTGSALAIDSTASDATNTRHIVSIINNNAAAVKANALYVRQDSTNTVAQFVGQSSIVIPVGTTAQRGALNTGALRLNTTTGLFEGYTGSNWSSFNNAVMDADADTKIIPETSLGADNDDLDFYTNGILRLKIGSTGDMTVGVDGTGYDLKLFGDTSGKYMLWDQSADTLILHGSISLYGDFGVGVDGTGHNVWLYGDTLGSWMKWDWSSDSLFFTDSTPIKIGDSQDMTLYHNGIDSYLTNSTGIMKIATETSGIAVTIGHTTSEVTVADNLTVGGELTVQGTTSTINATTLDVDDKNITMGSVATPTDTTADGGGLTLKGATDKTILWTNSQDAWVYNQGITVGADTDGHDVKFFGTTTGKYTLWDESADELIISGTLTETSMRELKTNIEPIENILPSVLQMQGVSFDWKNQETKSHYGFIAEDVDKILPNLVSHDEKGKALGIQYSKMTAVLLEAIKEQQIQIDELKSKLN